MKGRTDDLVEKWCLSRNRKLHIKLVRNTRSGCKIPVAIQALVTMVLPIQDSPQRINEIGVHCCSQHGEDKQESHHELDKNTAPVHIENKHASTMLVFTSSVTGAFPST